jgi:hypothetical protein
MNTDENERGFKIQRKKRILLRLLVIQEQIQFLTQNMNKQQILHGGRMSIN